MISRLRQKIKNKNLLIIVIAALFIKLGLFAYMVIYSPQGKFLPDSTDYLKSAEMIASRGAFAIENNGILSFEAFRTPGFPFFLAVFHYLLKIPLNGVVFIQILLAVSAAFFTYKAAYLIDKRTAFLSALIILISPPISIFSLQILADVLFLFLISLFTLAFIFYLKEKKLKFIMFSGILLALATYVRPVSYYFCLAAAIFIVYAAIRERFWKGILYAGIFLLVSFGIIYIWQYRNYLHFHRFVFTSIQSEYRSFPIFEHYAKTDYFLGENIPLVFSYINAAWNCFLSLMTRPGTLKYLGNPVLTVAGKIFGYPFVIFWWIGLLAGLSRIKSIYYQFALFMMAYFIFITIAVVARSSAERYSLPVIPLIAILSSAGWVKLSDIYAKRKKIHPLQHL